MGKTRLGASSCLAAACLGGVACVLACSSDPASTSTGGTGGNAGATASGGSAGAAVFVPKPAEFLVFDAKERIYFPLRTFLDAHAATTYWSREAAATRDAPRSDTTTTGSTPEYGEPKFAPINPIYLFFDDQGRPLFSRPYRDSNTGRFWMRGGAAVTVPGD